VTEGQALHRIGLGDRAADRMVIAVHEVKCNITVLHPVCPLTLSATSFFCLDLLPGAIK
jgi:hypothetical protein